MSVINKMLRDLDKRNAPDDAPARPGGAGLRAGVASVTKAGGAPATTGLGGKLAGLVTLKRIQALSWGLAGLGVMAAAAWWMMSGKPPVVVPAAVSNTLNSALNAPPAAPAPVTPPPPMEELAPGALVAAAIKAGSASAPAAAGASQTSLTSLKVTVPAGGADMDRTSDRSGDKGGKPEKTGGLTTPAAAAPAKGVAVPKEAPAVKGAMASAANMVVVQTAPAVGQISKAPAPVATVSTASTGATGAGGPLVAKAHATPSGGASTAQASSAGDARSSGSISTAATNANTGAATGANASSASSAGNEAGQVVSRQQQAARDALTQAQTLYGNGSRDAAIDLLQQAVAAAERSMVTSAANRPQLLMLARELARMLMTDGRSQATWEVLMRLDPVLGGEADLLAVRANAAQRLGRHQDSVLAYTAALQIRPNEQRWLLGSAVSLAALGQTAKATEMAEHARQVGPIAKEVLAYLRQTGVVLREP